MTDAPSPLPPEEGNEPIRYASPAKRVAAWVGIVYMLAILALVTYAIYTGQQLTGIAPLMLTPAAGGMGVLTVLRYRDGRMRGGLGTCIALCAVFLAACVLGFVLGVPALLAQL